MRASFCFDLLEKLAVGNPESIIFLRSMKLQFMSNFETAQYKQQLATRLFVSMMEKCDEDRRMYGPSIYACLVGIAMSIVPRDEEFESAILSSIKEEPH